MNAGVEILSGRISWLLESGARDCYCFTVKCLLLNVTREDYQHILRHTQVRVICLFVVSTF